MKLIIDISKDRYDEIMAMDWRNCRRFFDEEIRAIHDGMPQRTGHWITVTNPRGGHECSLCHVYAPSYKNGDEWLTKYCPECGCRMVEPQESDHKCQTCKHYTSGENDGSCGSYICKGYSNWESEG